MDQQVLATLRGYARANDFLERERMERLARLTTVESYAIFLDLVEHGRKALSDNPLPERMLAWQLETEIAARRTFQKLAEKQGLL